MLCLQPEQKLSSAHTTARSLITMAARCPSLYHSHTPISPSIPIQITALLFRYAPFSLHNRHCLTIFIQEMSDNCSHPLFRATAHALKNHDILCQIFEADRHVRPGDRLSSKDIVRCALASRAFCEPALRALWRNMSSPAPLWRLLAASPYSTCEELTPAFINTVGS